MIVKRILVTCLSIVTLISGVLSPTPVFADHTPDPTSVNLVGDLESEATNSACGDWDPGCPGSAFLSSGNNVFVFQSATIPAGTWQYKVALGSWAENYGANFQHNGPNINLSLASSGSVRFFYDHKTHYIADNIRNTIYTVPGSFNDEIDCPGEWQPECLRTFMSDVNGDGIFSFVSEAIPAGNYEFKVATNESWSNPNYGQGGGSANVSFSVPGPGFRVTFSFNTANNTPSVDVLSTGPKPDNNVEWDGLRHDSRNLLYRTPGGAVVAGTDVLIRFRTFHNDVTGVSLRRFDLNADAQQIIPMTLAASDVSCYQAEYDSLSCDFWQVTLDEADPNNLWYRFIVTDGSDVDYYADNTAALDGGLGAPSDDVVDQSYALMFHDPDFSAPAWAESASIYQIFPDRFRNGRANNDPQTGDVRYDDPVLKLPWGILPEGYCRNYADAATNCPWRFDSTPPDWSPDIEQPRGRDYYGGDLRGVDQYIEYLASLGVNTIYFNPIFDAGSNHSYDTQDYYQIDPYFGEQQDWENLVKHADQLGIRIVLDGVFNHLSSDSPFFDRYHHYPGDEGACESLASPYRDWFTFHNVTAGTGSCVDSNGQPNSANYDGWFGFDSIPVINKTLDEVKAYFLTDENSVSRYWLEQGASGWRLDVSGDLSFPDGYWESFRDVTKSTDPEALLISETWQKDSTLLRMIRGDRLDTTMNYRLRDAVIGLLAPGPFDSKGFADSGRVILPSEFAARMESIREDYPDAAYYTLMNLLDSHDTERLRWTLTPGAETEADKELNTANVTEGKLRQRIASLIQFSVPGAPTVFYGDEVGVTGDDDPDDRRTYPWQDRGGAPDQSLFTHYQTLNTLRHDNDVLVHGDFQILLADDTAGVVAFGRKTNDQAAVLIVNRGAAAFSGSIPVAGYLPDGIALEQAHVVGTGPGSVTVAGGMIDGAVGPMSAVLLLATDVDLEPTPAPTGLQVIEEGDGTISLIWDSVPDAAGYNLYRSPLSGGGWQKVNDEPIAVENFVDSGLENARTYYYVVTALDGSGNESAYSDEVRAIPHLAIDWANLEWPPTLTHTISATDRTDNVYGQVWIDGVTNQPGPTPNLRAQLGFGPSNSDPNDNSDWSWVEAAFNVDAGVNNNNDEFVASLLPETVGSFDYAYRYSTTNGIDWIYADLDGIENGYSPSQAGKLTVNPSGDSTAPAAPMDLNVVSAAPTEISLAWDMHPNADGDLVGFEVYRDGDLLATVGDPSATGYTDTSVTENVAYQYYIVAFDDSFNRSGPSNTVTATATPRTVSVTFTVTVPTWTPSDRSVHIAGTLSRFDGNFPDWDSSAVSLSPSGVNQWSITFTGLEGTQIEYKYTLGSPGFFDVEKDGACEEINNRLLTLTYGTTGTQTVNDTVPNWRNVAPCGS